MTRTEKLERIQKYRQYLYTRLKRLVPNLVKNPEEASSVDINMYNSLIQQEALRDRNTTFRENFSF